MYEDIFGCHTEERMLLASRVLPACVWETTWETPHDYTKVNLGTVLWTVPKIKLLFK